MIFPVFIFKFLVKSIFVALLIMYSDMSDGRLSNSQEDSNLYIMFLILYLLSIALFLYLTSLVLF